MMSRSEVETLIEKYNLGQASSSEKARLERWYHDEILVRRIEEQDGHFLLLKDVLWDSVLDRTGLSETSGSLDEKFVAVQGKRKLYRLMRAVAVAAIVLMVMLGTWVFWYDRNPSSGVSQQVNMDEVIEPGRNRAKLMLTNGPQIELSESQEGIVIDKNGITYSDGSRLLMSDASMIQQFAVLATPRGGTYQVTLPDGTQVWLNAASTLKYPVQFETGEDRIVELEGEAYFEVVRQNEKGRGQRFLVKTREQTIEVLGTHFNVSAYADEKAVKTTLIEGEVRILTLDETAGKILMPGQQSLVDQSGIRIQDVNTEAVTGWKSGAFIFNDTPLEEVMRQVSRWYDVEIDLVQLPSRQITGIVSREEKLSALLEAMTISSGLHFTLQERRLALKK